MSIERKEKAVYGTHDAIIDALGDLEQGDDITWWTSNGDYDQQIVSASDEKSITVGSPTGGKCQIIHRGQGTITTLPEEAQDELTAHGFKITKLVVWGS